MFFCFGLRIAYLLFAPVAFPQELCHASVAFTHEEYLFAGN
jgi:hypothetical protein